MRRRSRAGGEPVKGRRRNGPRRRRGSSVPGQETKIARLTRELNEAAEQQAATSEVLRVISRSPHDLQPVFESVLANATRLCEANFGILNLYESGAFPVVATHNAPPAYVEWRRRQPKVQPGPKHPLARVAATKQVMHIADFRTEAAYLEGDASFVQFSDLAGPRTLLIAPILKEGDDLVGTISIYRQEVRPFTDKQIALVQNFAAQAVIAVENTRLLNELRQRTTDLSERTADLTEALEQQTATSEVLQVISSSPGELRPVFDAILKNAVTICGAQNATLWLHEKGMLHRAARQTDVPDAIVPPQPSPRSSLVRSIETKQVIHVVDYRTLQVYLDKDPFAVAAADQLGIRTYLAVPMLKENETVGAISIYRTTVRPFTDKQIALVTSFAAQAVIAVENARLLNELRQRTADLTESLEQQTATAEVLGVISRSKFELQPILQSVVETAERLCRAEQTVIYRLEDGTYRFAAGHSSVPEYLDVEKQTAIVPGHGTVVGRAALTRQVARIDDAWSDPLYEKKDDARLGGVRSMIGVPLMRQGEPIGAIALARNRVEPFGDREIELVTTFADQAVIAIENARLLSELRESLEQQTATSEVLSVISASPGDLEPVFASMLENAARICDAKFGNIFRWDGEALQLVAKHNTPPAFGELRTRLLHQPGSKSLISRMITTKSPVHVADLAAEPAYAEREPRYVSAVEIGGVRTFLAVPMLKETELVGAFVLYRQEVRPFTDKQIALVTNFAAQAVIAIENTRLLNELRQRTADLTESLEQQTATSEVLRVISSSPSNLDPVFQAILANATRICGANFGALNLYEGGAFPVVATHNAPPAYAELRRRQPMVRPGPSHPLGRVAATKQVLHIADLSKEAGYFERNPSYVPMIELAGARTLLIVPMLKENDLVGTISIFHQEVRPFTDKQIELVQNFAAQAVIAIENTRLLTELRQRTADLTESLEQQTATAQVLQVISSSPSELQPVFEAMLENAVRICDARFGNIYRWNGTALEVVASHNTPPAYASARRHLPMGVPQNTPVSRMIASKAAVQVIDLTEEPAYREQRSPGLVAAVELGGVRTYLAVPMLKEKELIGAFIVSRQEVRPFTDKQIALVQNFAAQAVIAIENARLLNELRQRTDDLTESLEQQTATSEVLRVISSSPGDLGPVFASMLENAVRICDAKLGNISRWDGSTLHLMAAHNTPPAFAEFRQRSPIRHDSTSVTARAIASKRVIQVADLAAEPAYIERNPERVAVVELGGVRTLLAIPMLKGNEVIGAFSLARQEVCPFSDKQITLATSFANQAVIAIENTRLLNELRQRTDELSRSVEELRALGEVSQAVNSTLESRNGALHHRRQGGAALRHRRWRDLCVRRCATRISSARHLRYGSGADRRTDAAAYRH